MEERQGPCPTCGVPAVGDEEILPESMDDPPRMQSIFKEIKVRSLFESSERGCVVCAMSAEALSQLVLKDLDEATYKDASFDFGYDLSMNFLHMLADWFQKPRIYIQWQCGVSHFKLYEIMWEPVRLRQRLFDYPLTQAKRWIDACVKEHKKCNMNYESYLPRRVIHIPLDGSSLRLIEGLDKRARYAALSHCWGKSKHILTTHHNIDQHRLDIPFHTLPKTFGDAVTVCQQLKIEYLWIDSLCIIQDDRADWEQEAAKMGSVYENAFLTLAASAAVDDNGGFWFDMPSLEWKGETPMGGSANAFAYPKTSHDIIGSTGFPLSTRAWVFQEGIFSRRTLKFARQELLWECKEAKVCECVQSGQPLTFGRKRDNEHFDIHFGIGKDDFGTFDIWSWLVSLYSARKLSVPSDKLPAISGIAKGVGAHRKGRYLAGLWEDGLPMELLWGVEEDSPCQRPQKWRAPSWSWASVDSGVCFLSGNDPEPDFECRVLNADCRSSGLNEYGEVASGRLLIEGKLVKTKFKQLPPPNTSSVGDMFKKDHELEIEPEEDVFCMPVCVDVEKREYERIGVLYSSYVDAYRTAYPWWWGKAEGEKKPKVVAFVLV